MESLETLISIPAPHQAWSRSRVGKATSCILSVLFVLYLFCVIVWQHYSYFNSYTTSTAVFPSVRQPNLEHSFLLFCDDPIGCVVKARINTVINDSNAIEFNNNSDPCNKYKTQDFEMPPNTSRIVYLCYEADQDNGVAVLVHDDGGIRVRSSIDPVAKITNEEDWPSTFGYQKLVAMTPVFTQSAGSLDVVNSDDWVVNIQENLVFNLSDNDFDCETPADCGCTSWDPIDTNCEGFVFRLGEISFSYISTRSESYLDCLAKIGGLSLFGYFVSRVLTIIVFSLEARKKTKPDIPYDTPL